MDDALDRIDIVLGAMTSGPRPLRRYLTAPFADFRPAEPTEVDSILDVLLSVDSNNPYRLRFSNLLRGWDNAQGDQWAQATPRNTAERRRRIHELLESDATLIARIDNLLPFYHLDEPLIIATAHEPWYSPRPGVRDYYWATYIKYLRDRRDWKDRSLLNLDNSTRAIVECLANPESTEAYAARGLVMGYVQSGKTANFTGVVARAADAGYRLIIVLAGTWNILRNQTQRRLDKELLGKECLRNDETYTVRPPRDWPEFLEHGFNPADRGHYVWQRLTRPDIDFQGLNAAIDSLEFDRRNRAEPIYAPSNLHELPVKLLVVKKHSGILNKLVADLKRLSTKLADLPALVIDDESDQAGLNTVDPRRVTPGKERTSTNKAIVQLLDTLPRGQYIGYTATPYANALADVDDKRDLFPKDFFISLERPEGYMGVSDFFDPYVEFVDLDKTDFSQPEIALLRRVEAPIGADDEDIKKALRCYVLSGAMKLYRLARDPVRYRAEPFKHHTMLIHTSQLRGEQRTMSARVKDLWDECAFNGPTELAALEALWKEDFQKVWSGRCTEVVPRSIEELMPYLVETLKRIETGPKISIVVNSDTAEAPDFSAEPVWKIIIGGNKMSRGYTIEGLTVSYYRRVANTADTLMQMGRWFGFRPGYWDLVRVFLGVRDGKRRDSDLVSLFKEVCRMEERFREEVKRYAPIAGRPRITPMDIPPLIHMSGNLPPTSRNKRHYARLVKRNFGGQRLQPTLAPREAASMKGNVQTLETMLKSTSAEGVLELGGKLGDQKPVLAGMSAFSCANASLVTFLRNYRWLETDYGQQQRPAEIGLMLEFLEKQNHGITSWLVLAPQRRKSFGDALTVGGVGTFAVKERHRNADRGFQVYGEPEHRAIANYLSGIRPGKPELVDPNGAARQLRDVQRGVMLLYPVREEKAGSVSVGFELFVPNNGLPVGTHLSVVRRAERA